MPTPKPISPPSSAPRRRRPLPTPQPEPAAPSLANVLAGWWRSKGPRARSKVTYAGLAAFALFLVLGAADCGSSPAANQQATQQAQNTNAANTQHAGVPYPNAGTTELNNQKKWYETLSDPNKVAYIYLFSAGKLVAVYQIIAKCSSTNSQFSSPDQVVNGDAIINPGTTSYTPISINAPQPDGSYGQNEAAVFCFLDNAQRSMIEFSETWQYLWSDVPLNIGSAPDVIQVIPNGK